LHPITEYLNKGYYLGQRNSLTQLREGRGVWISTTFGEMYEGYWKNDQFQGKGRLIKFNGDNYEGQFEAGKEGGSGAV